MRQLLLANAVVLLCVGASGVATANIQQSRVVPTRPAPAEGPLDPARSLSDILRQNGRVWASIAVGIPSLGAAGTVVLVTNGFRFGMDAASVWRGAPGELWFLLPHGVLELASLAVAGAACHRLGWLLFEVVALNRRGRGAGLAVAALAMSAGIGFLAALVETAARMARLA